MFKLFKAKTKESAILVPRQWEAKNDDEVDNKGLFDGMLVFGREKGRGRSEKTFKKKDKDEYSVVFKFYNDYTRQLKHKRVVIYLSPKVTNFLKDTTHVEFGMKDDCLYLFKTDGESGLKIDNQNKTSFVRVRRNVVAFLTDYYDLRYNEKYKATTSKADGIKSICIKLKGANK